MNRWRVTAGMAALLPAIGGASAQDQPSSATPAHPAGWHSAASGSGATPAIAEVRADLPGYTVYRPRDWPSDRLPLVIWGNGACRDNGLAHAQFLREIASHGMFVIALGAARAERAIEPHAQMPAASAAPPARDDETHVGQMIAAMDWAEHAPPDLAAHIDPHRIAVMGHSCGGLQAISASADPRVKTTLIFDSGVYNRAIPSNRSNVSLSKADLGKLRAPIAYFIGGPTDIAYANAMDDVARIDRVPLFLGQLPVGHLGTFWEDANGGEWARAASAWLGWRLKGQSDLAAMFRGPDCGLCRSPNWSVDNRKLTR